MNKIKYLPELHGVFLNFKDHSIQQFYDDTHHKYIKSLVYFYSVIMMLMKSAVYFAALIIGIPLPIYIYIFSLIISPILMGVNYQNMQQWVSLMVVIEQSILVVLCKIYFLDHNESTFQMRYLGLYTVHIVSITIVILIMNVIACSVVKRWIPQTIIFYSLQYLIYQYFQAAEVFAQLTLMIIPFIFYHLDKKHRIFIFQIFLEKSQNQQWREIFNMNSLQSLFIFKGVKMNPVKHQQQLPIKIGDHSQMIKILKDQSSLIINNTTANRDFDRLKDSEVYDQFSKLTIKLKQPMQLLDSQAHQAEADISCLDVLFNKLTKLLPDLDRQLRYLNQEDEINEQSGSARLGASPILGKSTRLRKISNSVNRTEVEQFINCRFQDDIQIDQLNNEEEKLIRSFDIEMGVIVFNGQPAILMQIKNSSQIRILEKNREMNEMKDQILNTITHNLKTPLNGILLKTEYLINNFKTPPRLFETTNHIYQNAQWLLSMVNDMIDYSKITVNSLKLKPEIFNLCDLLIRIQYILSVQIKQGKVILETKFSQNNYDQQWVVYTDYQRLKQIMLNLVSNALQFTFKGSVIIEVSATNYYTVKIGIRDTGIGIQKEMLEKLLQPDASQMHVGSSQGFTNGAGIGLMITRRLIKKLGKNELIINSVENEGTYCQFEVLRNLEENISKKNFRKIIIIFYHSRDISQMNQNNPDNQKSISTPYFDFKDRIGKTLNLDIKQTVILSENFILEQKLLQEQGEQNKNGQLQIQKSSFSLKNLNYQEEEEGEFDPGQISENLQKDPEINMITPRLMFEIKLPSIQKQESIELRNSEATNSEKLLAFAMLSRYQQFLIVDDTWFNIEALKEFLLDISPNLDIDFASNGEEAVNKVLAVNLNRNFDLIFMDINMPVLDGVKASRAIKSKLGKSIKIISVTAFDENENLTQFKQAGIEGYIPKPVNLKSLINALKQL